MLQNSLGEDMALRPITGLAIGIGAALLGPVVAPLLRPLAKKAIKAGLVVYDQAKVAVAELNESTSDAVAQLRVEIQEEQSSREAWR